MKDNERENGSVDVSLIKVSNGNIEYYTENDGKIWMVDKSVEMVFGPKKLPEMQKIAKSDREY